MIIKKINGFTLIEIIVATFIFTIISMASYTALSSIIKTQEIIEPHKKQIKQLSLISKILITDISQIVDKSIINHIGIKESAFIINNIYEEEKIVVFTRPIENFLGLKNKSPFERISYHLIDNNLYRGIWNQNNSKPFNDEIKLIKIFNNIEKIKIKIITKNNSIIENIYDSKIKGMPKIIEFILFIKDLGEFSILINI